jgi:hypothetical protein
MSNESYRFWGVGEVVDLTATTSTASRRERWTLAKTASIDTQITIIAINRTAVLGARGVGDFSVLSCGRFTTQYPDEYRKRKRAGVHHSRRNAEMSFMTRSLNLA